MRVEPELPDHPKYLRLKRRVGDLAMESLVRIWGHCQQNQRGGLWTGADAEYLELIAKWDGEPCLLFRSLCETGWIEPREGGILIHDWEKMNGQIVKNWENGKLGGKPKSGAIPKDRNRVLTTGLTSGETQKQFGLPVISGGERNNPVVNPISLSVTPLDSICEPAQRNVTEHNETKLSEGSRVEGRGEGGGGMRYDLAEQVIDFLNEKTGAEFKGTKLELDLVAMCLARVSNDFAGVKKMVARQVALWRGEPKTAAWLKPGTLFEPDKFDGYFAMRELPTDVGSTDPVQRRRELEELIQKHPANRQSVFHRADVTEQEREELRGLRRELTDLGNSKKAVVGSNV